MRYQQGYEILLDLLFREFSNTSTDSEKESHMRQAINLRTSINKKNKNMLPYSEIGEMVSFLEKVLGHSESTAYVGEEENLDQTTDLPKESRSLTSSPIPQLTLGTGR